MAARGSGLSDIDVRTLEFMIEYEKKHLFPPSLREIAAQTGVKSTSSIFMRVRKLEDYGKLSIDDMGRITLRGLSVVSSKDAARLADIQDSCKEEINTEGGSNNLWRQAR